MLETSLLYQFVRTWRICLLGILIRREFFLVKSAYHVLVKADTRGRQCQIGETSEQGANGSKDEVWKKIWSLPCPPKIKQFMWRVAHNSLPMKMNIKRRHIDLDTSCPVCLRYDEDGGHCFLKCKQVRQCWREVQLDNLRCSLLSAQTAKEFVWRILKLRQDQCLCVCLLLWRWWDTRNKANAGEPMLSYIQVVNSADSFYRDLIVVERRS